MMPSVVLVPGNLYASGIDLQHTTMSCNTLKAMRIQAEPCCSVRVKLIFIGSSVYYVRRGHRSPGRQSAIRSIATGARGKDARATGHQHFEQPRGDPQAVNRTSRPLVIPRTRIRLASLHIYHSTTSIWDHVYHSEDMDAGGVRQGASHQGRVRRSMIVFQS